MYLVEIDFRFNFSSVEQMCVLYLYYIDLCGFFVTSLPLLGFLRILIWSVAKVLFSEKRKRGIPRKLSQKEFCFALEKTQTTCIL